MLVVPSFAAAWFAVTVAADLPQAALSNCSL